MEHIGHHSNEHDSKAQALSRNFVLRRDGLHPSQCTLYNTHTDEERHVSESAFLALAFLDIHSLSLAQLNRKLRACGGEELLKSDAIGFLDEGFLTTECAEGNAEYYAHITAADQAILGDFDVPVTSTPKSAEIHFTRECNLRCAYCGYDAGVRGPVQLPASIWKKVLGSLQEQHVQVITLSGGEPLMHPEFYQMLEYIVGMRIGVRLLTNATLLTTAHAELLAAPHITTAVSLDAVKPALHDALRGNGTHRLAMSGLEKLSAAEAKFRICCTLTERNISEVEALVNLAESMGAQSMEFGRVQPVGRAEVSPNLLPKLEQILGVDKLIRELAEKYRGRISIAFNSTREREPGLSAPEGHVGCPGGTSRIAIAPDGGLYPCVLAFGDEQFEVGNLASQPCQSLWLQGDWAAVRTAIPLESLVPCGSCEVSSECVEKNCRLGAYYYAGSLHGQPPICPLLETALAV
ncbi:radical SAM protein [Candidatus Bipolaricaulota bacterium]